MIKPKMYKVKKNVTVKVLEKNGFIKYDDSYKLVKQLYNNYVYLRLYIDVEDKNLIVNILDNEGCSYAPFFNPDDRHDNLVYEQVVNNYNNFMDDLVHKNILDYSEISNTYKHNDNSRILKIKYHTDIEKIKMIDTGDWIDLRVAEDTFIPLGTSKLVSLGISMKLPDGYEAHIAPRSSTFKNFGIVQTNSVGIIDNSYSGTNDIWKFPAYCLESRETVNGRVGSMLHKNDRICQFRIVKKQEPIIFEEVDELDNKDRGGFGSTGRK